MPVEKILEEIRKQEKIILSAMKEKESLYQKLENMGEEEYDWVSASEASSILRVSLPTVYKMIHDGRLEVKHIYAKKFVRKSQIEKINMGWGE